MTGSEELPDGCFGILPASALLRAASQSEAPCFGLFRGVRKRIGWGGEPEHMCQTGTNGSGLCSGLTVRVLPLTVRIFVSAADPAKRKMAVPDRRKQNQRRH